MSKVIFTENLKDGYSIKVVTYNTLENPRLDCSNLGTLICFGRRISFGDMLHNFRPYEFLIHLLERHSFENGETLESFLLHTDEQKAVCAITEELKKDHILVPVFLHRHSADTLSSCPFGDKWDSAQIGWIYTNKPAVIGRYGSWSDETIQKARAALEDELRTYNAFINNECYRGTISTGLGKIIYEETWIGDADEFIEHIFASVPKTDPKEISDLLEKLRSKIDRERSECLDRIRSASAEDILKCSEELYVIQVICQYFDRLTLTKEEIEDLLNIPDLLICICETEALCFNENYYQEKAEDILKNFLYGFF